ncbi:nucleotidyltransferase family protein [Roseobacteraceae bacterium S113]
MAPDDRRALLRALGQICAPDALVAVPDVAEECFADGGHPLVALAFACDVAPLLHWALVRRGMTGRISADMADALEAAAMLNGDRNARAARQMHHIGEVLGAKGIAAVFLKGAAVMASDIYAHASSRQFSDLDVLVPADQLNASAEALRAAGYVSHGADIDFLIYEVDPPGTFHDYPALRHDAHPALVELHTAYVSRNVFEGLEGRSILGAAIPSQGVATKGILVPPREMMARMAVLHDFRRGMALRFPMPALKDLIDLAHMCADRPERDLSAASAQPRQLRALRLMDHYFDDLLGLGRIFETRATLWSRLRWRAQRWACGAPGKAHRFNDWYNALTPRRVFGVLRRMVLSQAYRTAIWERLRARP